MTLTMILANINRFDIWLADLNPQRGTEVGKVRPVLVIQTDLINHVHDSTIVCPITTRSSTSEITKVKLPPKKLTGLDEESWVILDQIRALDNRRLIKKLGILPQGYHSTINQNLRIVLDL